LNRLTILFLNARIATVRLARITQPKGLDCPMARMLHLVLSVRDTEHVKSTGWVQPSKEDHSMAQVRAGSHEEVGVNWVGLVVALVVALALFGGLGWWLLH
jgi:hypothetical protein